MYLLENEQTQITSIDEEHNLFNQFISNLPNEPFDNNYTDFYRWSPLYYQDYNVYYDENNNMIPENKINIMEGTYIEENISPTLEIEFIIKPLPAPTYTVNYNSFPNMFNYSTYRTYNGNPSIINYNRENLTYIVFDEFKTIWTPLS
jgi:hypothetical protein